MCGLCGELRFDGLTPEKATLSRMNEKLARRGPDDEGVFITGPMGFGHRRLSVIDLSNRSHQPMV
ncbi:MAG: N-acetylglutaminylglutamine amidotransferase, partial [Gammaproteobacteria bacterium]|nr:N-acetylglutaminylglutamine amidotransferase [Gammaproteobacteria bacterium]